jgi:O-antigen ligase
VTVLHSGRRMAVPEVLVLAAGCALAALAGPLAARSSSFTFGVAGLLVVLAALAFTARWPAVDVMIVATLLVSALVDIPQHIHVGPTSGQGVETIALVALLALLCLNGYSGQGVASVALLWPFVVFLVWASLSFSWGHFSQQGLQNVFVYAGFVEMLLIGATAGRWAPWHTFRVLDRAFMVAAAIGCSLYAVSFVIAGHGNRYVVSPRPFGLFGVLVVSWFMAAHVAGVRVAKYFVIATVVLTLLSLSRSALAAQFAVIVLAWVGTTTNFRTVMRSVGVMVTVAAVALAAVFLYAPLNKRFFGGDKHQVGGISINVTGRDALWSANWAWFKEKPVMGWGAGSSDRMTSALPGGFSGHPHNDYLRLLVDYGVIGLVIWLIGYITLVRLTWRGWRAALPRGGLEARIQCAAFLALTGVALTMLVDNPLIEVGKMAPLGALAGLALGTAARPRSAHEPSTADHQVAHSRPVAAR